MRPRSPNGADERRAIAGYQAATVRPCCGRCVSSSAGGANGNSQRHALYCQRHGIEVGTFGICATWSPIALPPASSCPTQLGERLAATGRALAGA